MPIYEYRCSDCGAENEFLQKISDPPMTTCPACGKDTLQKLVSAAGFQLKGSGWYATDFKNNGKGAKPAETRTEAKPESKSESKSEAAPACGSGGCAACTTPVS